jgi:hypothetical protein
MLWCSRRWAVQSGETDIGERQVGEAIGTTGWHVAANYRGGRVTGVILKTTARRSRCLWRITNWAGMPWVFEVLIPLPGSAMSLSVLRLAEQDHPLPRTSRRWSVGHAQGGEVCPTRNGIRRCRGLDSVYLCLLAFFG